MGTMREMTYYKINMNHQFYIIFVKFSIMFVIEVNANNELCSFF